MGSLKEIVWKLIRAMDMAYLVLRLHPNSALVQNGWFRSFKENKPVNYHGQPIPWLTYPFIKFIEGRLTQTLRVFEYGCGNSTIGFSQRVSETSSLEHDPAWAQRISPQLPSNSKVIVRDLSNGYVEEINNHGLFDIVIIDGRMRIECGRQCLNSLSPTGVVIWDDSNLSDFSEAQSFFSRYGFRELDFYGMVPAIFISSQTSILYRDNNCLGI
jgi:hypothetical protein